MSYFNIMSIDPGNNIGVSIFTIDSTNLQIVNVETRLFILENVINSFDEYFRAIYKLNAIQKIMTDLLTVFEPLAVGMETAFLNSKFPKAVMQLSQYTAMIEHTVFMYNSNIKMFKYMPRYIKKYVGASGSADKHDVCAAVASISELKSLVDTNVLSEHEIDAIAISFVVLEEIRLFPYILYAL